VPAVELDGARIADSVFILDRLEARHPQAPLWPANAAERSVDRLWDCFATDTLYWQGLYLRWLVPETRKRVLDARFGPGFSFQKFIMTTLAPRLLRARARGQGIGGRAREDVETSFATSLDMIVAGLGTGPFLQSRSEPGRGDLAIAAHLAQFAVGRPDDEIARLPAVVLRLLDHCDATFRTCGLEPVRSPPA
jgi:glutathione S-transferase